MRPIANTLHTPPQSAAALLEAIRQRNTEKVLSTPAQLPLWPEPMRGVPNAILRTALFGAVRRGKRRYMEREPIASLEGVEVNYTGPRLDQADLDVWEGALHLARLSPLGNRIEFTEKSFLKMIDRGGKNGDSIGRSDREWLRRTLARLSANTVEIKHGPYAYGGSLVDEYFRDESVGRYVLMLNPRMKALFGRDGWTLIDWGIHCSLRGHPLAQWLHGFYSSHAKPFPMKEETLHRLCGSEAARMDHYRQDLHKALNAVAEASAKMGQAFSWELQGDLVSISRDPSKTQRKHLRQKAAAKRPTANDAGHRQRSM